MAKKTSLFSGGSRSTSAMLTKGPKSSVEPLVDISQSELNRRAQEKMLIPQHPLVFTRLGHQCREMKEINYDFSQLSADYPLHQNLINQLLVGLSLSVAPGVSTRTIRGAYNALPVFVSYLNSPNKLTIKNVITVSDIDLFLLQDYKTYLISNFQSRHNNFLSYTAVVKACNALRKKYPENSFVGEITAVPKAPQKSSKPTEGYNRVQIIRLIKCCIEDIKAVKAFHSAYESLTDQSAQILAEGNSGKRTGANQHFMEVLATIKCQWPEYPYYMSLDEAKLLFSQDLERKNKSPEVAFRVRISNALEGSSAKISYWGGSLGRGGIFAAMHFVPSTIYPFLLLSIILTGFNAECLKFFSDDIEDHMYDDLIDPEKYIIILGYKGRTDDILRARCKKNQAHGVYRLLKYVKSVIAKYGDSEHYVKDFLFQFTRQWLNPRNTREELVCSFKGRPRRFAQMGMEFVKRHRLEKEFGSTIVARKLRSGYATIATEGGITPSRIGEEFGHKDAKNGPPETAEKHYLSDAATVEIKRKVVAGIQNRLVADICEFEHRVVMSKTLQQLRNAINSAKSEAERNKKIEENASALKLEKKTVTHLLDVGVQTYILVCEDMSKPSWPGHKEYVKNGQCRQYNKCCLCKQSIVFPEALPYIAKRIIDIEKFQKMLTATEWTVNFGDEYDGWVSILSAWSNQEQVSDAWEMARADKIYLPKIMKGGTR